MTDQPKGVPTGGTPNATVGRGTYSGKGLGNSEAWKCPKCGALNARPLADGCVSCGAGTQAERDVQAHRRIRAVTAEELVREVGTPPDFTPKAIATVAAALAHYAEHGVPGTQELTPSVMVAWARQLMAGLGA